MSAPRPDHPSRTRAWLEPAASAWLVALGIHGLHVLHLRGLLASPWIGGLLLVPLLGLDVVATRRFHAPRPGRPTTALAANLLFWLLAFAFWVVGLGLLSEAVPWLTFFGPWIHAHLWLVWRAEGWWTIAGLALCVGAYVLITVRARRGRVLTAVVLPALVTAGLGAHLNSAGGPGAADAETLMAQPGVRLAVDPRALPIEGASDRMWHPRDVCVDPADGVLFAAYGCSWCFDDGEGVTVLRWDPATGDHRTYRGTNVHHVDCDGDPIWVAPWLTRHVTGLSRADLSPTLELERPTARALSFFQPIQVLADEARGRVYVGSEASAALVAWDRADPTRPRVLRLADGGRLHTGGPLQAMALSAATGRLYATAGPGDDLFEIDPDAMTVVRSLDLGDVIGTALAVDDEGGVLYYQSGVRDALFRVRLDTLAVDATWEGELHARRMVVDRDREQLLVLGYLSGRLVALDLGTGARRWEVAVGARPHGLALAGGAAWVSSRAGILRVELAAREAGR